MAASDDILLRIGADVSDLKKGLLEARRETDSTSKVMDEFKSKLLGVAGVLGLGLGFTKLVGEALQYADAIQKASDQTGIAAEDMQFLRYAADQTGTAVEGMTSLIGKMQTQLVEAAKGNKDIAQAVADLGLNIGELRALSPDQQFAAIATEIAKIKDPGEQAAMAVELFGKSGKDALPLIKDFAEGQGELRENFEAMGGPVSAEAIKAVDDMGDAAGTTALGIKAATVELIAMVAPVITGGLKLLTSLIGAIRGEAEPAAGSLEDLNGKLATLLSTQQKNAVVTNYGMGLSLPTDPRAAAALQKEIDDLRAKIQAKKELMEVENQVQAQVAEELETITIVDEARRAALEKERMYLEQRRLMLEAEAAGEIRLNQEKIDAMAQAAVDGYEAQVELEQPYLEKEALYHAQTWDQKVGQVSSSLSQMTAGVARESRAMFEINKAAAMASAVVNTAQGVTQALAAYPPPLSFAMAAVQAAAGAAQIAAISKSKFGSGVAPSQATTPATPVANVGSGGGGNQDTLRVQGLSAGDIFSGSQVAGLAKRLLEYQADGGRVVLEQ